MMGLVNKPHISKFIAGLYLAIVLFIAGEASFLMYVLPQSPLKFVVAAVLVAIELVMIHLLISIYGTRYILTDSELIIKTTRLIGGPKRIRLEDITNAERTLVPFGVRLFGASLYGGYHYIPGLGRAFITMTNFNDAVLLRTKHENYVITPRDPEKFIKVINSLRGAPHT